MIADVPHDPIVSFAQNREDVVLWRALGGVTAGRYVEIGANHPTTFSVTRAFYDHGWSGITVEPIGEFVDMHRSERPRDAQVQAAVVARPQEFVTLFQIDGTGLSTTREEYSTVHQSHGWSPHATTVPAFTLDQILDAEQWRTHDTHFMVIDVEGAEAEVLTGVDLTEWRPWVVVVESTEPLSATPTHQEWESILTDADYEFCMFDGVSRFYVAGEHAELLREHLAYPACALDPFIDDRLRTTELDRDAAGTQVVHWRTIALTQWADALAEALERSRGGDEAERLRRELEAMRQTLSWRITWPLRFVRLMAGRVRSR